VSEVDFDVIVVGAGIAGCVTAYALAEAGRSVALIERGEAPGAKNLSGGVLYTAALRQVFGDLLDAAPIERRVRRHHLAFLNEASSVGLDYADAALDGNAVTMLRAPFDAWLGERCEAAGVFVMPGIRVDSLLLDGNRAVGVRAGDDELRSRVVVAADGVNSLLARGAGLRAAPPTRHLGLGIKATIGLPSDVIEARFGLTGDAGAAHSFVGGTSGVVGGGFIYTNRASLSVGLVLRLDSLVTSGQASAEVFDRFLAHPLVAGLVAGGEVLEYGSHLVPEGGRAMVGRVASDGLVVVGDAAGLCLNTGLTVRGMDLAAASGVAAATGIDVALTSGDVSETGLAGYRRELMAGVVGQDLATYAKAPGFLGRERLYGAYGDLLAGVLRGAYRHDLAPRRRLLAIARDELRRSPVRLRQLASDVVAGVRSL